MRGPLEVVEVDLGPSVRAGFTTRTDGASGGSWQGLNLALHVEDDPDPVRANRRRVDEWAGAPVVWATQVHGTRVEVVGRGREEGDGAGEADALVTTRRDVALGVLVADCLPVLLADPSGDVVASVHAGRRGLAAGVLQNALAAMVEQGAQPERVRAVIGPAAGACCYEVPEQMRDEVAAAVPGSGATTRQGTPALDLAAGARGVLGSLGVGEVVDVGICTIDDPRFYSYRRAEGGRTGRFAGIVRLLP